MIVPTNALQQTMGGSRPRHPVEQAGAICYRDHTGEILLITSRRSGRWGIPKGNIDRGETSAHAAAREAFEEAGILGTCMSEALGEFYYEKDASRSACRVIVHLLVVREEAESFPELGQRASRWLPVAEAVDAVYQAGLKDVLRAFARVDARFT